MLRRYLLRVVPPTIVLVLGMMLFSIGVTFAIYPALVAFAILVVLLNNVVRPGR